MTDTSQRLVSSCLAIAIVIGIFLTGLLIIGVVVFSTQIGNL